MKTDPNTTATDRHAGIGTGTKMIGWAGTELLLRVNRSGGAWHRREGKLGCPLRIAGVVLAGISLFASPTPAFAVDTFAYQQLLSFDGPFGDTIGTYPIAGVIQGADAALYGTTAFGGPGYSGTVVKLNPDGTGFTVLHAFGAEVDGYAPFAGLTRGSGGELYGITAGSNGGYCTLFKLNPDGSGFQVLHAIDESLGASPRATLIQGSDGALYGTSYGTEFGFHENANDGMVFKINTDGTGFTILHTLDDTTGRSTQAPLIQTTDGALYGTTPQGGSGGVGTVFKLNPDGTGFTVLQHFDSAAIGANPDGGLIQGPDGALYGTAIGGGNHGFGTVFKLNVNGTGFTVLRHFDGDTTGAYPRGGLLRAADGALYGTTSNGGSGGAGTTFRLNPDGSGFLVVHNFETWASGRSGLMQTADGVLYGTTIDGGANGGGSVFGLVELGDIALTPAIRPLGGGGFTLTVDGDSFEAGSVVQWDGMDLETTFVSSTRLTAVVPTPPPSPSVEPAEITVHNSSGLITGGAILLGAQIPPDSHALQTLKAFGQASPAGLPRGELLEGADGALYGTAQFGGAGVGTVFRLNPDGSGITALHAFDRATTGASPHSGLIQGSDGTLYGTATEGGVNGAGTIYKLSSDGSGFVVIHHFDWLEGGSPFGGLLLAADEKLYGTTANGGSGGGGTVFTVNTDGTGFAVLKNFDFGSTGSQLRAGLIQGTDGALYGTTSSGGNSGGGTVFKLSTDGSGFVVLKHFGGADGAWLYASLIQATDGSLYGTASSGGSSGSGTLFKLNTDGSGFEVIKHFNDFYEGRTPRAKLIQGLDGALYGTTYEGGTASLSGGYSGGTLYKVNLDGTGFTVLQNLNIPLTGGGPESGLVQSTAGALYGVTTGGGINEAAGLQAGTVFTIAADGSGFAVINHLTGDIDLRETGGFPEAPLFLASDGRLYGPNPIGGSHGNGTIFGLNTDGSEFTVLHHFDPATTGSYPTAALIQGMDGALYGTVSSGGPANAGNLFRLNPDGSGFTVLHQFDWENNGGASQPMGRLLQSDDGTLYGTTIYGGMNGGGTLFRINPDGTGFAILIDFDGSTSGERVTAGLIQATDGKLFGTAYSGGSEGGGTLFSLNEDGSGFSVLLNLDESTGTNPYASLLQGMDGALYGVTTAGGSTGSGTAFRINPDGTGFAVLHHFENASSGANPGSPLVQEADGTLYGSTDNGGLNNEGTIFRLNPEGTEFSLLYTADGARPASLTLGSDGTLYGAAYQGGAGRAGFVFRLVADTPRPSLDSLAPATATSGSGAFTLTVTGSLFAEGAIIAWDGEPLATTFVSDSEMTALVTSVPTTDDLATALITVRNPDGGISDPLVFVVTASNVTWVDSAVAGAGESASVSTAPDGVDRTAGVAAMLTNAGNGDPVTVSAAAYGSNPSPSLAFELDTATGVAGEFIDLQVTGADDADTLSAGFYYPVDTDESGDSPVLKYYNGADWVPVLSSGGVVPAKDTTDNLDGTESGGRLDVVFDGSSTPKITELGGTYFAITYTRPPLDFTGFLPPIGGADSATGGSFANPVRTFKAGSTIPIKFNIARATTTVTTGVHRLHAVKYTNQTTAGTPIDATPQGAATSGNAFVSNGGEWHFNLDTRATGLTPGIWFLVATLSDGSSHFAWIQVK